MMECSSKSATRAYLDTLKLCYKHRRQGGTWTAQEPGSNEFVSALAAGMKATLIVEVTSCASQSTIALAVAARQTEGKVVCILPESALDESKQIITNSGLIDQVEFRTEDPTQLLPYYENIDFFLIDCKEEKYAMLLNLLSFNPTRSIIVASNLLSDKKGLGGYLRKRDEKIAVRSLKHPLRKGMEVTKITKNDGSCKRFGDGEDICKKRKKSTWVAQLDEESGEEHIFRVPQVDWFWS